MSWHLTHTASSLAFPGHPVSNFEVQRLRTKVSAGKVSVGNVFTLWQTYKTFLLKTWELNLMCMSQVGKKMERKLRFYNTSVVAISSWKCSNYNKDFTNPHSKDPNLTKIRTFTSIFRHLDQELIILIKPSMWIDLRNYLKFKLNAADHSFFSAHARPISEKHAYLFLYN